MEDWHVFTYQGTKGERGDVAVTMALHALDEFKETSRSKVQALVEAEGVVYDGKLLPRPQKNLRPGMLVEIDLAKLRALLNPPAPDHITPLDIPLEFAHIDDDIAVVVKPAGLTVHPSYTETGPTLCAALLHHFAKLSDEGGADRPGIVHRLDKETSGLLVIARNNAAHVNLSRQFADRLVDKEYLALCIDAPEYPIGRIDSPIERHPRQRQKMWSGGHGRNALTEYQLSEMQGTLALLNVSIFTGRTHQIRVHLLEVGCAILGDDKYGGGRNGALRKFLRDGHDRHARGTWREAWPDVQSRQAMLAALTAHDGIFLHAKRLGFTHPVNGKSLEFEHAPPDTWAKIREQAIGNGD